jgi:hypothetical protein
MGWDGAIDTIDTVVLGGLVQAKSNAVSLLQRRLAIALYGSFRRYVYLLLHVIDVT